eukprot:SAG22_NODE_19599_length_273_cov_0.885057_1_plen_27_part_10
MHDKTDNEMDNRFREFMEDHDMRCAPT